MFKLNFTVSLKTSAIKIPPPTRDTTANGEYAPGLKQYNLLSELQAPCYMSSK